MLDKVWNRLYTLIGFAGLYVFMEIYVKFSKGSIPTLFLKSNRICRISEACVASNHTLQVCVQNIASQYKGQFVDNLDNVRTAFTRCFADGKGA